MTMGRCDVNPSKQCRRGKGVLLQTDQLLIEKLHRKSARNENPNLKFILNKLEISHLFGTKAKDIATINQRSLGFFIGTTFIQQLELQFVIFYLCEL